MDITGDAGHATAQEFDKFECATMITFAYVYKKTKKFIWTFSSFIRKQKNLFGHSVASIQKMKCSQIETLCLWAVY